MPAGRSSISSSLPACRSRHGRRRYGDLAPAVWLYAANIAASTAATLRLASLSGAPAVEAGGAPFRHFPAALFLASALLSVAISLFDPADAMWAYLLNVLLLVRWPRRHGAAAG